MKENIKILFMDVDGTMTNGDIYCSADGEEYKTFNVKDGYAIAHILPKCGITPVIITGRQSGIVEYRAKELGVTEVYQGSKDKLLTLIDVLQKFGNRFSHVAYIGDDINDIECIKKCGFTACPADAVPEVLEEVDYVCRTNGGRGAVREFIDVITK